MGQAKLRRRQIENLRNASFSRVDIEQWERSKCLNFAVGLARKTGWLLHIDWAVNHRDFEKATLRVPVRAHVGSDRNVVFDPRGVFSVEEHAEKIVRPLVEGVLPPGSSGEYGVETRTYDDRDFTKLNSLGVYPDEAEIVAAQRKIVERPLFLARIPCRPTPTLPAKVAADFSWGNCLPYAEALREITGLPALGLVAVKLEDQWGADAPASNGYVHSLIVHPDGTGEDSWGRQPMKDIAARYHAIEWRLDLDSHSVLVEKFKSEAPERYSRRFEEAKLLISTYRTG